jgi:hypothetical protein
MALSLIYPLHKSLGHAPFSFSFFVVLLVLLVLFCTPTALLYSCGCQLQVKVKVKFMLRPTVQLASLSWNKARICGLRPDLYYCQTVAGLLMWGALSDERTGLSFARLSQQ